MSKEETFISEMEKLKNFKNAPIVEAIVSAFKACRDDARSKVAKSFAVLESARNAMDKKTFTECLDGAAAQCRKADIPDMLNGLEMYKKFLLMK